MLIYVKTNICYNDKEYALVSLSTLNEGINFLLDSQELYLSPFYLSYLNYKNFKLFRFKSSKFPVKFSYLP